MKPQNVMPEAQSAHAIRMAAHEWHAQIEAGDMGPTDRQRFERWLAADPAHRAAYERAVQLWQEVGALDEASLPAAAVRALPRERFMAWFHDGRGRWLPRLAGGGLAFAAMVVLLVQLIPFGWLSPGSERFETAVAEIREVTLSDGSLVTLGAKTRLSVAMTEGEREIELHAGEAYFDVAKDPKRPFIVRSDGAKVEAIGTAFELRLVEDGLRVAVAEGIVDVAHSAPKDKATPARLRAGQRVSVNGDGEIGRVKSVDPGKLGAWRRGRLAYIGAPLSEVVADANRYHDGWIFVRDQQAADLEITASFAADDIDGMFATLAEALPIVFWRPISALVLIETKDPAATN